MMQWWQASIMHCHQVSNRGGSREDNDREHGSEKDRYDTEGSSYWDHVRHLLPHKERVWSSPVTLCLLNWVTLCNANLTTPT